MRVNAPTPLQIDLLMDKFVTLDTDGDGYVLVSEWFASMVRAHSGSLSQAHCQVIRTVGRACAVAASCLR